MSPTDSPTRAAAAAPPDAPARATAPRYQSLIIAVLVVIVLFILFAFTNSHRTSLHLWPDAALQVPSYVLLACGIAVGVLATVTVYWIAGSQSLVRIEGYETTWSLIALFCVAVMALAATGAGEMSFTHAALLIVAGSIALVAAAHAIRLLGQGETIELQSQWGGLGGGLGGWRITPVTSLVLLALAFGVSAVGIGLHRPTSNDQGNKPPASAVTPPQPAPATQAAPPSGDAKKTPEQKTGK